MAGVAMRAPVADYGVRDVVYFVARRLRCFRGVDKLVSIIFLAQYDVNGRAVYEYRCGGRPLARTEFYVWHTGVMSDEVYDAVETGDFDMVEGGLGLELCYSGPAPQLPSPAAHSLDEAASMYKLWKRWQLRHYVKKLLGLDVQERLSDYVGQRLYTYLREEGFNLTPREICL